MNDSGAKKGHVYVHPSTIDYYAKQTWKFAKVILWNNVPFLPEEIELALDYIRSYYQSLAPESFWKIAGHIFRQYCERILMVKRYLATHAHYHLPHPCIWFNPMNRKGFAGTRSWCQRKRKKGKHSKKESHGTD